jgi:hypothetical protein
MPLIRKEWGPESVELVIGKLSCPKISLMNLKMPSVAIKYLSRVTTKPT